MLHAILASRGRDRAVCPALSSSSTWRCSRACRGARARSAAAARVDRHPGAQRGARRRGRRAVAPGAGLSGLRGHRRGRPLDRRDAARSSRAWRAQDRAAPGRAGRRAAARLARQAARPLAGCAAARRRDPPLRRRRRPLRAGHAVARPSRLLETGQLDFLALLPRIETRGFWESVLMPVHLRRRVFQAPAFLANWRRPRWIAAGGGAGNLVRRARLRGGRRPRGAAGLGRRRRASGVTVKRAGFRARRRAGGGPPSPCGCTAGFARSSTDSRRTSPTSVKGWLGAVLFALTAGLTVLWVVPPAGRFSAASLGCAVPAGGRPWRSPGPPALRARLSILAARLCATSSGPPSRTL